MSSPRPPAPPLPSEVVTALRCSVCAAGLEVAGRSLRCVEGHAFDIARQGYVNLLHAKVPAGTADTAEMVAARAEFLDAGFYAPLAEALADVLGARTGTRMIVDAGAGTGHYLARVLERLPEATGLALDVSARALRRAARAHPRIGAAVWNLWQPWPVRSRSADAVLNVFAPRNAGEFGRVLRDGGTLVVAAPGADHLAELAELLGLLDVDRDKEHRLDAALAGTFERTGRTRHGGVVTLSPADARRAVLMGPNAHHLRRDGLGDRLAALTEPVRVTTSFTVSVYRKVG